MFLTIVQGVCNRHYEKHQSTLKSIKSAKKASKTTYDEDMLNRQDRIHNARLKSNEFKEGGKFARFIRLAWLSQ